MLFPYIATIILFQETGFKLKEYERATCPTRQAMFVQSAGLKKTLELMSIVLQFGHIIG